MCEAFNVMVCRLGIAWAGLVRTRWCWTSVRATTLLVLAHHGSIDTHRIDQMCQLRPTTQRVTILPAGHDLHLDQPEAWIATLQQFLAIPPTPASR